MCGGKKIYNAYNVLLNRLLTNATVEDPFENCLEYFGISILDAYFHKNKWFYNIRKLKD